MVVSAPTHPLIQSDLERSFRDLGVRKGQILLLHASLRALGSFVVGGPTAVVLALREVLGAAGTLVVPAQNKDYVDPSRWPHRSVDEAWWSTIRLGLPGFDPAVTPSLHMGQIAERVRTWPGSFRSGHPHTSFAAVGAQAEALLREHPWHAPLGPGSPLACLEAADARVLLLGVGFDVCTAFHLAESRLPGLAQRDYDAVLATPAGRRQVRYRAPVLSAADFAALGDAFERGNPVVRTGTVGAAHCRLFPLRAATAFADEWLRRHRPLA